MDKHGADESRAERDRRHGVEVAVREIVESLIATVRREGEHLDEANALEAVTLIYNAVQPALVAIPADVTSDCCDAAEAEWLKAGSPAEHKRVDAVEPGYISLRRPDGTWKTNNEIRSEAAQLRTDADHA